MDNLSEYIPILIILVSVIFTAIGKRKKQGNATQETTLSGQTAGEFVDESHLLRSYADSYQTFVEEKPKKQKYQKPDIKQEEKIVSHYSTPVIIESEEDEKSPYTFEEDDDIIRAIVYTEIINRKEY